MVAGLLGLAQLGLGRLLEHLLWLAEAEVEEVILVVQLKFASFGLLGDRFTLGALRHAPLDRVKDVELELVQVGLLEHVVAEAINIVCHLAQCVLADGGTILGNRNVDEVWCGLDVLRGRLGRALHLLRLQRGEFGLGGLEPALPHVALGDDVVEE